MYAGPASTGAQRPFVPKVFRTAAILCKIDDFERRREESAEAGPSSASSLTVESPADTTRMAGPEAGCVPGAIGTVASRAAIAKIGLPFMIAGFL
jgi:hypothetical protein